MKTINIQTGDLVEFKKEHPCGGNIWLIERTGYDVWLRCQKCHRLIKIDRGRFEKRYKKHVEG